MHRHRDDYRQSECLWLLSWSFRATTCPTPPLPSPPLSHQIPWAEYDNHMRIMLAVGNGSAPQIPDSLGEEGHEFLKFCFEIEPSKRWSASQLLNHAFVKVSSTLALGKACMHGSSRRHSTEQLALPALAVLYCTQLGLLLSGGKWTW